jgi:hypothetical protein
MALTHQALECLDEDVIFIGIPNVSVVFRRLAKFGADRQ